MSTNEDDLVDIMVYAKTHTDLLFFTDKGKVYRVRGYRIPEFSRNSKGLPIINLINIEKDENVKAIIHADEYAENHYLLFVTTNGVVKRTAVSEFASIRQNGKIAISLREGDNLLDVKLTDGNTVVGIAASNGKLVKFNENEVRSMGRTASGVKGMDVSDGSYCVGVTTSLEGQYVLSITQKGFGKMSLFNDYRQTKRGAKGVITIKSNTKIGKLVSVRAVNGDEDLMVVTNNGIIIRTPLSQIKIAGRNTQGVKIIRIEDKQKVSSIAIVEHVEEEVEESVDTTSTSEETTNE